MGIPWSSIALASAGCSFAIKKLEVASVSQYSLFSLFLVLYFVIFTLCLIYNVIIYPHLLSPLRHLPTPAGASFFNGHFHRILNEPTSLPHVDWINEVPNDGLITYRSLLNLERVMPTTPQALNEVLTQKAYDFTKPPQLKLGLGRVLGIGLLLAEGEEHRIQRRNLMPAFSYRHIKDLCPLFWEKSLALVEKLMEEISIQSSSKSGEAVVNIAEWASRATLDIIGTAGLGKKFNALEDPDTELCVTYRKVLQPTRIGKIFQFAGLVIPNWILRQIPSTHNTNIIEATKTIRKVARDLIRDKQAKLDQNEKLEDVDILSVAIKSGGFSEEDLVNQLMTFLAAGHETTATALTWAIYLIAKDAEVQTRLRDEIRGILPSPETGKGLTHQELDSCTFLRAVCNETLRLYAPAPITLRVATKDTTLQGQFIPKNTHVMPSVWAINRSVQLWGKDAGEFKPERWMGPGRANTGGAESNYAFMTFLHGPRSCIGQAFAKHEFECLVGALVARFDFKLEDAEEDIKIGGGITARPKNGLRVRLRSIEGW